MLGLYIAKMAIRTLLLPLLPSPRSVFLPIGTGLPPENFEKIGVVVRVYSEALEIGPLQVYSLGFFSVLDDHRPAGPLLGCQ